MTRHSAFDDRGEAIAEIAPPQTQADTAAMLRVMLRAHLMRGALEEARGAAELLAGLSDQDSSLGHLVSQALDLGQVQLARRALAEVEGTGRLASHEVALLKARIATAQGDPAAARAILVAAIEATPDQLGPRRALTEVMVATGTAADARAVLTHLGAAADKPAGD